MEDNMMYPIKDQETMLVVAMDMNRQQDTGYRIEIQGLHVRSSEEEPGEEAEAGGRVYIDVPCKQHGFHVHTY
uniref:Uncharacterized protein n=1 Tax=Oryza glumipatula TaxID=40148 RepID=A0A0E0B041_9ORYZ